MKIPAQTGIHNVNAGFSTLGAVTYLLQVTVGTDVIYADSGAAPANVTIRLTPQFTLTSGVEVSFGGPIFHGEQTQLVVKNLTGAMCSTPVWHPAMNVELVIGAGRGLGILTTGPGVSADSSLTVKGTQLTSVSFIANGRQPSGTSEAVIILAKVNGTIIGSSTVQVYRTVGVTITNPMADTTITLSATNQPLLLLQEKHVPEQGETFEPTITWSPSNVIDTKDYYGQIKDSLKLIITVTAENAHGIASDSRTITLIKKGCDINVSRYAQADILWKDDQYDHTSTNIGTLGCALSCMAMFMTALGDGVSPGELNRFMKDSNGYDGRSVKWSTIEKHSGNSITKDYKKNSNFPDPTKATGPAVLDIHLAVCALAIVKVFNANTGNEHWVVITGKKNSIYTILDPGRGETTLDGYGGRFWSYLIVRKSK